MTEKRFVYGIIRGSRQAYIKDCHTCKSATIDVYGDDFKYFVDLLNALNDENEQLKSKIAFFEEQEDEFEQYTAQTIQNMIADYRDD